MPRPTNSRRDVLKGLAVGAGLATVGAVPDASASPLAPELSHSPDEWSLLQATNTVQRNGVDCGIHMLLNVVKTLDNDWPHLHDNDVHRVRVWMFRAITARRQQLVTAALADIQPDGGTGQLHSSTAHTTQSSQPSTSRDVQPPRTSACDSLTARSAGVSLTQGTVCNADRVLPAQILGSTQPRPVLKQASLWECSAAGLNFTTPPRTVQVLGDPRRKCRGG